MYKPDVEIVPTVELPPTIPSTSQVIAVFVVPETVALNCCFCFSVSGARRGLIVTVTAANDATVKENIVSIRSSLRGAHLRVTGSYRQTNVPMGCTLLAMVA